jgi:hypothetical protein
MKAETYYACGLDTGDKIHTIMARRLLDSGHLEVEDERIILKLYDLRFSQRWLLRDITPCSPLKVRRFGETDLLHLQCQRINKQALLAT